ncbi:caspase-3-like isoform X2 [Acropora millepora]|uniref:caspase-3-like isoform X2 n=1 Tax=Acropora millepora TaxID=45264 RepID=UPI001CF2BE59|nr:caspase-3-like isoform X2 [Acropora millepora]
MYAKLKTEQCHISHTRCFPQEKFSVFKKDSSSVEHFRAFDQEDLIKSNSFASQTRLQTSLGSIFPLAPQCHWWSADEAYDGIRNPYVLVINNVNFHFTKVPRPRNGASHDRDNIREFTKVPQPRNGATHDRENIREFVKEAGFEKFEEHFDLTKGQMLDLLEKTRLTGDLVMHDSFICIIMSHGDEEGILGADSQSVPVDSIIAKFQGNKCPQLATKPKLFFLQACRGKVDDNGYHVPEMQDQVIADAGEKEEMPVKLPTDADVLIAYSTTKGYLSHRRFTVNMKDAKLYSTKLGSWFISCLVQIFLQYSHREDLMTMLTRVNNSLSQLYSEPNGCKQISCQLSMLTKKVYFANFFGKVSP